MAEKERNTINLDVPADMKQWLKAQADKQDANVSLVVRGIIRKAMNEQGE